MQRESFGRAFEARLHYLSVCATGLVSKPKKQFLVTVNDPSMLQLAEGVTAHVYAPDVVSPCDGDVVIPKLRREVKPAYSRRAMEAGVAGTVHMTAIVEADGKVGDVKVVRSLHKDLDGEAVKAIKGWQFEPGSRNGTPAPVVVSVEMSFTLKR